MAGLEVVIELLAQSRRDLAMDVAGVDAFVVALVDLEHELKLADVGLDGGSHVGVLQLARKLAAVMGPGAVDLAEGRGRGGDRLEGRETRAPVGAELARHAALDERPAHGWRVGLKLGELGRVFTRQRLGDRRHDLRDLHQRPLEAAERAA